jgi:hypothetical protein
VPAVVSYRGFGQSVDAPFQLLTRGQRAFDDLLQIVEADDPPVTFDKNGLIEAAATAKVIVDRSEVHAGFRSDGFAGGFSVPGGREQRSCGFHDAGTGQLAIGTGAAARFGHS